MMVLKNDEDAIFFIRVRSTPDNMPCFQFDSQFMSHQVLFRLGLFKVCHLKDHGSCAIAFTQTDARAYFPQSSAGRYRHLPGIDKLFWRTTQCDSLNFRDEKRLAWKGQMPLIIREEECCVNRRGNDACLATMNVALFHGWNQWLDYWRRQLRHWCLARVFA